MLSFWYNAPLFVLCSFWLWMRTRERHHLTRWQMLLDALVVVVAALRFFGSAIPPSGHALFLTHSFLTVENRTYQVTALLLLMVTVALKVSWHDYRSWVIGILVGAISGLLWRRLSNRIIQE